MKQLLLLSEKNKNEILNYLPELKITNKLTDFFQNFSDYTRLRIIICLSVCDMCVNDLSIVLKTNQSTISHQLQQLRTSSIVNNKRKGKLSLYSLNQFAVNEVMLGALWAVEN